MLSSQALGRRRGSRQPPHLPSLAQVYGASVSKETISRITGKAIEEMAAWQARPLDAVYAAIFLDAIVVKVRDGQVANRPV